MLTVYKASAGSGKTFTLTYEYIKLLLGYKTDDGKYRLNKNERERHRSILAITFTNKATAEMKRRIVQELAVLAGVESVENIESPYTERLISEFGCSTEELKKSARNALFELLFDFNFFNISTIDSFFQNVLRIFAREAELMGNYEVELNDEYAVETGIDDMLSSINRVNDNGQGVDKNQRHLTEWLKKYMMSIIEEGGGFNMFNRSSNFYENIVSFVNKICDEEFKLNSEKMLAYLEDATKLIAFEQEIALKSEKIKRDIISKSLRTVNMLSEMGLTPKDCLNQHVRTGLISWASGIPTQLNNSTVSAVANSNDDTKRYLKKYSNGAMSADFDEIYLDALTAMCEGISKINLYQLTRKNLYILGLLGNIIKRIDDYRNENNLILLSDTNDILQRIISEEELPFIYERVGVNLKHFLIDEFQDTSRMQWLNLQPLVSESLSHDNDNLIIGDEKQCIYRFRNSDPSLLREQVQQQFHRHCRERGSQISENTNWRSSADVVKFNNTIFTAIADVAEQSHLYGNVAQQISPKHVRHRGYVKFAPIEGTQAEYQEQSLELMTQEIKRQLQSGYRASDIAILVRKGSEGRRVIDYLLGYVSDHTDFPPINILSNEALTLGNSNAVRLIISVLKFIDTPDKASDTYHFTAREISRLINRYEYFISKDNAPSEALKEALSSTVLLDDIANEVMSMDCISLPSIVERIISRYVPQEALSRENIYITALQDAVVDFCSVGSGDIHSFLKWWDMVGYKSCLSFPDSVDAINVMTVHKSKGLEFSCVHIPFASWDMFGNNNIKWFDTAGIFSDIDENIIPPLLPLKCTRTNLAGTVFEQQYKDNRDADFVDEMNATYVAFTRAVDELIVNYQLKSEDKQGKGELKSIGDFINEAILIADAEYCAKKISSFGDLLPHGNRDIFTPLKEASFKNEGVLIIGTPTVKVVGQDIKSELKQTALPYFTADRNDMWNLSVVEDLQDIDRPRDRGIILHNMLGDVRKIKDISLVVHRHAHRLQLSAEETSEIEQLLVNSLKDERVIKWFDGFRRVITERTIALPSGDRYRPDRVVWTAEGTVDVVDYKFGEPHPRKYANQVKNYMKLLQTMGYDNVRGFIWYLDTGIISEV